MSGFLNGLSVVSLSSTTEGGLAGAGGGGGGVTTVRLRGLPVGNTLVLINGRRLQDSGASGVSFFFNLNLIPLVAVERIEVLPTGSSAIYGGDAHTMTAPPLSKAVLHTIQNTTKGREFRYGNCGKLGYVNWVVKPDGEGREFWRKLSIADHIDQIEAPILMNLPDRETFSLLPLIRHLADETKPYDAYVFPNETHIKWQPAHLQAIMNRNLDCFRFWLQDCEDPAPAKTEQYAKWRELRALQCKNPRSLRDYCGATTGTSNKSH